MVLTACVDPFMFMTVQRYVKFLKIILSHTHLKITAYLELAYISRVQLGNY